MFPSHRVSRPDAPLGQIQHDPESFRYIQIRCPGFAYIRFSHLFMSRVVFHFAKSAHDVTNTLGTFCESILAFCCAPDCQVLMATSGSEKIEA
jgi:hypothetical protein